MTIGIWILGDRLSRRQSALSSRDDRHALTPVIFIESLAHVKQRPYHRQKLVFIWSAMRHFAAELKREGWPVSYKIGDDFEPLLREWILENDITELRIVTPNDIPFRGLIEGFNLPCPIVLYPDNHFFWSSEDFALWAEPRKRLLLEDFYREGRKRFRVLMEGNQPSGGRWNFDKENRKPPRGKLNTPEPLLFPPDEITRQVIGEVKKLDIPLYGKIEPFYWGVTREHALAVLDNFVKYSLPFFGPYQDAMVTGEDTMWHALLSPYLNIGLLTPVEVVEAAENAYLREGLELNSVEGFIRQVLGWREYMRGIYHYYGEEYAPKNFFAHREPLPDFYRDSDKTDMNCLKTVLSGVEKTAYGHHIQRLMILSNFALIYGVSPREIENWFHGAFIDAYDWVMRTNVIGMGQFADGGILASKPYASSANYIDKMSDYCDNCRYKRKERLGESACPFNFLYWDFLDRHREKLQFQGRMGMILGHLDRIPPDELNSLRRQAATFRQKLTSGEL